MQYFIVNDDLEKLYFVFYDPRVQVKPYFKIEVNRKDIEDEIKRYLELEREILKEVEDIVLELTGF